MGGAGAEWRCFRARELSVGRPGVTALLPPNLALATPTEGPPPCMEEPHFNTRDPGAPWEVNTQIPNIPDILPHKHGCSEPGAAEPPHPLPPPPYPSDINKAGQSRGKTSARPARLGPQSPLPPATPAGRNEEMPGALVQHPC